MREPQMGLTFEQVWAMFQETDRKMQETDRKMQETDRKIQESNEKMDRMFEETNRVVKAVSRDIGKLGNRFGDLVEHLVSPGIKNKFNDLGYRFTKSAPTVVYDDSTRKTLAEVDLLLENGDYVLAVEVKSQPTIDDVKDHIKRMETLRGYADEHHDKQIYLGAVAGAVFSDSVKNFSLKTGFFVIEQSGDTMQILTAPEPWQPKAW
ncbi:hypothetical protein FACS1894164_16710 [Spirochaetia bacterium]|nr:hypothetical protein FACS1894164_16710 [Spirochaetia bacterium]